MSATVNIAPEIEVTVTQITCNCGTDLGINGITADKYGDIYIEIEACEDCKTRNHDEGYQERVDE